MKLEEITTVHQFVGGMARRPANSEVARLSMTSPAFISKYLEAWSVSNAFCCRFLLSQRLEVIADAQLLHEQVHSYFVALLKRRNSKSAVIASYHGLLCENGAVETLLNSDAQWQHRSLRVTVATSLRCRGSPAGN